MAKEKSLVEEAIIQMKNLEEAVAENAKGILASTMSQEIKELVKESLTEQEEEEIDTEVDMDDMDTDTDMDDTEMDDVDVDVDMEDDMDTDNFDMDDEDDTIDLTDVDDDEEILRVFQLMGPEDNIVVTKDDSGNISLKDEENNKEYMIVGEGEEEEEMFEEFDDEDEFEFEDEEEDMDSEGIEDIISKVFDNDDDSEMGEGFGGNKHDFKRRKGHKIGDVDGHYKDFESEFGESDEMEFDEEEDMDDEEIVYEISFDEEDDIELDEQDDMDMDVEDDTMMESKMTIKPKGTGLGNPNKKKVYSNKPNQEGGFKTVKKSVNPTMGTGKAKFDYKDGENSGSKFGNNKIVKKTETKEQTTKVDNTTKKVEPKEASRTLGSGSNFRRGGLPKPRAHSSFNTAIKENTNTNELRVLREKNEEYRKALNVFRNKLNEVAVFNSNLAYATRLFTEHSTSKQEKINILRRFDGVENIKESKNLYKVIKDELTGTTSQPMNESLERTIAKAPSTGSAINLIESKTYENPQFLRMKDLMSKLK
jgi:hypothetical protein